MGDAGPTKKTESEEEEEEEEDSEVIIAPKTGTAGMFKIMGGPPTVQQEGTAEFKTTAGEIRSSSSSHFESSSSTTTSKSESGTGGAPAPLPGSGTGGATGQQKVEEVSSTSVIQQKSATAGTGLASAGGPVPLSGAATGTGTTQQKVEEISSSAVIQQKSTTAGTGAGAQQHNETAPPVPQPERKAQEPAPQPPQAKKSEPAPVPQPQKAPVQAKKAPDSEEEEEDSEATPPIKPKSKAAAPVVQSPKGQQQATPTPDKRPEPPAAAKQAAPPSEPKKPAPVGLEKPTQPAQAEVTATPAQPKPARPVAPPADRPVQPTPSATARHNYQEGTEAGEIPQPSKIKQDNQALFTQDAQQVLLPAPTPTHHSIKEFAPKMEVEGPHRGHPEHAFSKAGRNQVSQIAGEWGAEKENEPGAEPKLKVQLQEFVPYTHDDTVVPTGEAVFAKAGVGKLASDWPPPPSGVPRTSIFGDAKKRTKLFDETSWVHTDQFGAPIGTAPWSQGTAKIGEVWPPPETPMMERQVIAPTIIRTEEVWHPDDGPIVHRSWPAGQAPIKVKPRQWPPPSAEEIYQMQLEQYQQQQQPQQQQQQQQIPPVAQKQEAGRRLIKR